MFFWRGSVQSSLQVDTETHVDEDSFNVGCFGNLVGLLQLQCVSAGSRGQSLKLKEQTWKQWIGGTTFMIDGEQLLGLKLALPQTLVICLGQVLRNGVAVGGCST